MRCPRCKAPDMEDCNEEKPRIYCIQCGARYELVELINMYELRKGVMANFGL